MWLLPPIRERGDYFFPSEILGLPNMRDLALRPNGSIYRVVIRGDFIDEIDRLLFSISIWLLIIWCQMNHFSIALDCCLHIIRVQKIVVAFPFERLSSVGQVDDIRSLVFHSSVLLVDPLTCWINERNPFIHIRSLFHFIHKRLPLGFLLRTAALVQDLSLGFHHPIFPAFPSWWPTTLLSFLEVWNLLHVNRSHINWLIQLRSTSLRELFVHPVLLLRLIGWVEVGGGFESGNGLVYDGPSLFIAEIRWVIVLQFHLSELLVHGSVVLGLLEGEEGVFFVWVIVLGGYSYRAFSHLIYFP